MRIGNVGVTNCYGLKIEAPDGKQRVTEGALVYEMRMVAENSWTSSFTSQRFVTE